ncbi:HTH-type transcriptional regulator UlaR [Vibrio sp. S9_S30]|uniref:HTH-type transcriptional regulator UlaR n=1 Tax=Vibrio sp. S9_S30 TaxID=2720226 RepID=UPI0016804AC8|nr:HTH-type transcriptional regulator UlaR [Vibrio sp. S9_S30]MBD1558823.1 HTH-type transcriptional regulator UlaR [Vibrio sp. S9_S30]
MTEAQRHSAILNLLQDQQYLTVADIIDAFEVSPATARRDINKLNDSGKLRKVRNGAEALSKEKEKALWSPMNIHNASHLDEKVRIAKAAANLIQRGESAVINCGSTAFLLGQEVCGKDVQVITNYFPLASYLIGKEHRDVVILGGQYNSTQSITLAPQDEISSLYAGHWMFTSGKGLNVDGLYKMNMLTAMAEQKMLDHIGKLVVLADSSKLGQRAGMLFCSVDKIHTVITGTEADSEVIAELIERGVNVLTV